MLVITRKLNEELKVGDDVTIEIIEIRGNRVRLGITAPRDIEVHRKEVWEAKQKENEK